MDRSLKRLAFASVACISLESAAAPVLERIVELPATQAHLHLDDAGRPYLITAAAIVPLQRLASGAAAQPFRVAGASKLEDAAWIDGVLLLVVGRELGAIGDHGFAPLVALPTDHLRIAAASADTCWLFGDDRLYTYTKGSAVLVEIVPARVTAIAGTPARAYLAIGTSLVRRTPGSLEIVFDSDDPILAVADTPTGAVFSTRRGVFALVGDRLTHLATQAATGIAIHGDDAFLLLDGIGLVHTSVASIGAIDAPPSPSPSPSPSALPEPELTSPPDRAAFTPPSGPNDFRDVRLSIRTGVSSAVKVGDSGATLDGAWAAHVQRVWSKDLPGLVWSLGLAFDRASSNVAHAGSTFYNMAGTLGLAYGVLLRDRLQVEIGPLLELDAAALDQPFSSATAWGNGWGVAGALSAHYLFNSGFEIGGTATYGVRYLYLSGDCTPCTTPSFSATVTTTSTTIGLSIGRRY